jgi:hypothetical protein
MGDGQSIGRSIPLFLGNREDGASGFRNPDSGCPIPAAQRLPATSVVDGHGSEKKRPPAVMHRARIARLALHFPSPIPIVVMAECLQTGQCIIEIAE